MKKTLTFLFLAAAYFGYAQPMTSAPTPTEPSAEVTSVYSQSYTNIAGVNYNPGWGQATTFAWHTIGTDSILEYAGLNYQGIEYGGTGKDVNGNTFKTIHLDIWSSNMSDIRIFLIGRNSGNERAIVKSLTANTWNQIDIDISEFTALGLDASSLWQMKFEDPSSNSGTFYADNIFFYGTIAVSEPETAAPNPLPAAKNVFSVYSESYTDPVGVDYFPNWGQSTTFMDFAIGEDSMIKYGNINYQGILLGGDQDLSEMEFLHLDVWSSNVDTLLVFPISSSTGEKSTKAGLNDASWTSIDIPLTTFTDQGLSLTDVKELKLEDLVRGGGDIFIDNIYFYRIPTPLAAAPAPTAKEDNVISIFSNAYTDVTVNTFRTDWSAGQLEEIQIDGNDVKKYFDLDQVGIEMIGDNSLDLTSMDSIRFDVWTPDADLYRIKIVDFGADNAFGGGDDVEHTIEISGAPKEEWVTHKIAMSDLTLLTTRANISQIIFSAQPIGVSTLYIDNIYFSKTEVNNVSLVNFSVSKIYPNPATNVLNVNLDANNIVLHSIELVNLHGQVILTEKINATRVNTSMNLDNVEVGVYFLNILTDRGSVTKKVIVK